MELMAVLSSSDGDMDFAAEEVRRRFRRVEANDLQEVERFRLANHMVGAEGAPALGLVIRISGRTTPPALVR